MVSLLYDIALLTIVSTSQDALEFLLLFVAGFRDLLPCLLCLVHHTSLVEPLPHFPIEIERPAIFSPAAKLFWTGPLSRALIIAALDSPSFEAPMTYIKP